MKRAATIVALCVGAAWSSTALAQVSITRNAAFAYDPASGLLTQETIEPGSPTLQLQTNTTYDAFGNKLTVTKSGYGFATRQTSATYDSLGQFITTTANALGQQDVWQYDPVTGRPASHVDPNGLRTTLSYDFLGRKTLEVRPDGNKTSYAYNFCGTGPTTCISGAVYYITATPLASNGTVNGPVAIVYFDSLDREIGRDTQGFDGSTVRALRQYDSLGRVAQSSRPFFAATGTPQYTVNVYDALNRVTKSTAPDGSVSTTLYQGPIVTYTNANNQTRTVMKDGSGKVIQVTDAFLNNFYYVRDPLGNVLNTTDVYGDQVMSATYDQRGRKISMTDADLGTWTYQYDALDELISQTDAKGQTTTFAYDQLGRQVQRVEPDMISVWTYDTAAMGIGKLASTGVTAGPAAGYQRNYSYDQFSRAREVDTFINNAEYTFTAAYDSNGHLSTVNYPSGSSVRYSYNNLGYADQLSDAFSSNALWTLNALDAEQHITQQTAGNGVVTNQGFSLKTGRLLTVDAAVNGNSNNAVQDLTFTYDPLGNLTSRTDGNENFTESFQYDPLNRLTQASINTNVYQTKTFSYDAVGDLLSKSDVGNYTYPTPGWGLPQPHAVTSVSGGTINTTFTYDANGNQLSGNGRSVTWRSYNKPASITQGTRAISFLDGPDHQRFMQTAPEGNTLYFDCFGVHAELTPGNNWNDYFAVGNVLVGQRVTNAATETVTASYFFHTDHLGSISVITDQYGSVVQRLSYDPWGKSRLPNGADGQPSNPPTTRGFTAQEELTVSGLVHLNGRVYDPMFGRMISADPTVPDPLDAQAWNRYSYVGNDPLTFTDPSGFSWLSSFFNSVSNFFRAVFANPIVRAIAQIAIAATLSFILPGGFEAAMISAAASTAIVTGLSGGKLSDILRGSVIAAVTAGLFYGVGSTFPVPAVAALGSDSSAVASQAAENLALNVVGHAAIGCLSAAISGGECGPGALSAAAGAGVAPFALQTNLVTGTAISGLVGGLASVAGGGKFENGAITGAFGYLYNAFSHAYSYAVAICSMSADPNCTLDLVWQGLLRNAYPGQVSGVVTNNGKSYVASLFPIYTMVDPDDLEVTNVVLPGHIFYSPDDPQPNGSVSLQVVQNGDEIDVDIAGHGTNPSAFNAWLNTEAGNYGFYGDLLGIKAYVALGGHLPNLDPMQTP